MTPPSQAHATAPDALKGVLARMAARLSPSEVWLFGSRARGDARADSDWDLLAVVADDAPGVVVDPVFAWETVRACDVPVTLLVKRKSDLAALWGRPNTIGWVIANEGIRLRGD